ncbi:MAG: hypothetical protein U0264_09305 [Candidatus Kapaibacterium sp.]
MDLLLNYLSLLFEEASGSALITAAAAKMTVSLQAATTPLFINDHKSPTG